MKRRKSSNVASTIKGFVLVKPSGKPQNWTKSKQSAIASYVAAKGGIILDDDGFDIELERLERDGWKVRPSTLSITYDD